jgi:hypothetical protein
MVIMVNIGIMVIIVYCSMVSLDIMVSMLIIFIMVIMLIVVIIVFMVVIKKYGCFGRYGYYKFIQTLMKEKVEVRVTTELKNNKA